MAVRAPEADSGVLEIGAEDDASPWSRADGSGYANELVLAAFAAAGVKVHLQVLPYARCKQMVMDGTIPACFSMSQSPELAGSVEFASEPLFVCHTNYVETAARASAPRTRRTVGAVLGYEYPPSLHEHVKSGEFVLEESVSEELNLKKLADGRIDAALINTNETKPLENMIAEASVRMKVKTTVLPGELDSYLGFSRKHPRGASARAEFDEGFRRIAADGTKQRITAAWIARATAVLQGKGPK